MPSGHGSSHDGALERERGVDGVGGAGERGERAVALTLRPRHAAAVRLGDVGRELVVAKHHAGHHVGMGLPEVGRALDVGERERHDARGYRSLAGGREALDEVGRTRWPTASGRDRGPRRTIRSSRFASSGAMPSQTIGSPGEGGAPVSAKTVVAASPNMSLARLGAVVASSGARYAASSSVGADPVLPTPKTRLSRPPGPDEDVLGPDVGVDDGRFVPVEVVESVGDRRERRRGPSRAAAPDHRARRRTARAACPRPSP